MKVLFVTQSTIGGTLEYFKLLIPRLMKKGYDITVVCPSYGPMKKELENMNISVHTLEMVREMSPARDFRSIMQLAKFIRNNNFDLVHAHSSKAGAVARIASFLCRIPCIYTPHGWSFTMDISNFKRRIYILIEKFLSSLCRGIIAISEDEMNMGLKYKVAGKNKIHLITNGIDISKFESDPVRKADMRRRLGIPPGTRIVGMAARLAPQKDIFTFIRAARKILDKGYNVFFILTGDGELKAEAEKEIECLGLSGHFLLTGWVEDVRDYINIFDVGVLTSRWEGFGLVLAEYMANKVPVVASKTGGIPGVVVEGETGILIPPGDIQGFAEAIITLLSENDMKNKLLLAGYNRVCSEFSIDRVAIQHEALYKTGDGSVSCCQELKDRR